MKKLNLSYFHYYRKHYGWIGHFWQGRFKSQTVGKDEYFIQCGKYIERNPVRAKLVTKSEEYRYSSARYYLKGEVNDLITRDFMYGDLGKTESDRQLKYQEMVIDDIVKNNYKKTVWGSDKQRYNESKKIKYHHPSEGLPDFMEKQAPNWAVKKTQGVLERLQNYKK